MLALDHPVIISLQSIDHEILWKKGHPEEKNLLSFWNNNLKERRKKNRNVDKMRVLKDSAIGYGAELATTLDGVLSPVNSIVDDPMKIPFADRMRDYRYDKIFFQGKTSNLHQDYWYISPRQMDSLEYSVKFNDYLIITGYTELGDLHYRYCTRFIVDFKAFMLNRRRYLLSQTAYKSYPFNHENAIEDGICHQFKVYNQSVLV